MDALDKIAAAVLYEGYVLWPYRRSARKNQQRWTFGRIYPRWFVEQTDAGDRWTARTQVLVRGESPSVQLELRFLQVVERRVARSGSLEFVDEIVSGNQRLLAWDEAVERRIGATGEFSIAAEETREAVEGGVIVRSWSTLSGELDLTTEPFGDAWRVTASVTNTSNWTGTERSQAQRHGLMSAHLVLRVTDGAFVSATDPPAELVDAVAACRNDGLWPVLVENEQTLLASPIILYDYPQIAPESPGLLFDSGEIDQLLYLNTLALTDAEKAEIRGTDPRARELLERAESMGARDLNSLHGAIRDFRVLDSPSPPGVFINGSLVQAGTRVRLHPRGRADIFDLVLDGKLATIESIEQDFDDRVQLAVALADDPGTDLGLMRMPGHRFFFSPEEVEPLI